MKRNMLRATAQHFVAPEERGKVYSSPLKRNATSSLYRLLRVAPRPWAQEFE